MEKREKVFEPNGISPLHEQGVDHE